MNPLIGADKQQAVFSSVIFLIVFVLAFFVFMPFLTVLILSMIFAVLLTPVFRWFKKYVKKDTLAALLTIVALVAVIILPLAFITNIIVSEAQALYTSVSSVSTDAVTTDTFTAWVETRVQKFVPEFTIDTKTYLAGFSSWIVSRMGGIFSGTLDFVIKLALSFVALFYFLRDGEKLRGHITALSPWSKERDRVVMSSIRSAIKSVVAGSLIIALIQGLLVGIGLTISGVPNPTLWGTIAAVCALVPGFGTALVWIPATLFLIATGAPLWAIIFQLVWSLVLVSLIDNFLGPIILEKGINIHPLLILFSVLGGIQFFGPEGFLLGPLVLSVLFVLIRTFKIGNEPSDASEAKIGETATEAQ